MRPSFSNYMISGGCMRPSFPNYMISGGCMRPSFPNYMISGGCMEAVVSVSPDLWMLHRGCLFRTT